jgi:hypothetical protein
MVPSDIPDAVYARPGPSWRERTYPPKHAPVWVRIEGAWHEGAILYWVTIDPAHYGWECQIETDVPGTGRRTARYVYDELTIRQRASPELPSAETAPPVPATGTKATARIDLKPTGLEGGTVYAVKNPDMTRPGSVIGWIQHIPEGWRRYGYEDTAPVLATSAEAVDDLITYDAHERETATWP